MKNNLNSIEPDIDPILKVWKDIDVTRLKRIVTVLFRTNKKGWDNFFENFCFTLKKIASTDADGNLGKDFKIFLSKLYDPFPLKRLYDHLERKGYTREKIDSMELSYDEGARMNRLPNDSDLVYILVFYLFKPYHTYRFFMENPVYLFNQEEKNILKNYRKLSPDLKTRASTYMQKLTENDVDDIFSRNKKRY